jgi:hypothetical protein
VRGPGGTEAYCHHQDDQQTDQPSGQLSHGTLPVYRCVAAVSTLPEPHSRPLVGHKAAALGRCQGRGIRVAHGYLPRVRREHDHNTKATLTGQPVTDLRQRAGTPLRCWRTEGARGRRVATGARWLNPASVLRAPRTPDPAESSRPPSGPSGRGPDWVRRHRENGHPGPDSMRHRERTAMAGQIK